MPVHPYRADEAGTLLGALVARRPQVVGVGEGGLRSGVVHRLDVDTSGVVLLATEQRSWQRLRAAFRSGAVEKRYRALVLGRLAGAGELALDLVVARHRPPVRRDQISLPSSMSIATTHSASLFSPMVNNRPPWIATLEKPVPI